MSLSSPKVRKKILDLEASQKASEGIGQEHSSGLGGDSEC